ncbi:MAG: hypothetical protein A3G75_09470 [Verrucomicrobia bacterium RIFCSPLOWO2_12_FULL_64_8]|nr:MAG: hypothetical protein A3G75_09470 [Verrucomicrobia bacterium RIFCSPLOWO2_12_FULL_64_8]
MRAVSFACKQAPTGALLALLFPCSHAAPANELAQRVVLLANSNDPDSVRLARHYAQQRGVPDANVVALPMSMAETVGWPEFIASIYQPLQDELVARGWIDAFGTSLTDALGRKKYGIMGLRLSYLVVCRGVPLRISHEPRYYADVRHFTNRPEFRTNRSAVDSELTLLAHTTYNINAWLPNPLFLRERPPPIENEPVVKVARLDGPTYEQANRLVDLALAAERSGLMGRYYVEVRGPHSDGEQWLETAAERLAGLGFDGDVSRQGTTLPVTARLDAPAFYFGWYANDLAGAMALDGFRFPPGAIALHIHSFSAQTLRSATSGWCGPLVAHGVTATFGNVDEPYLQLTHLPHHLVRALAEGKSLGDAAYYALPALSWQSIVIGDPLYRPFAVSLGNQLANLNRLPSALAPYVLLRQAHRLDGEKKSAEALALLQNRLRQNPGLVLGLELARRLTAAGDQSGAARVVEFVARQDSFTIGEVALAHEAARVLAAGGEAARAVAVCRIILRLESLTPAWRAAVLRDALAAARAAGDTAQAIAWEKELVELTTPAPSEGRR